MAKYLKNTLNQRHTPQNQPIPGTVPNSAGGYSFPVDQWDHLKRFLILGSEGGSYYANEQQLTLENAKNLIRCIEADGQRVVQEVVAISQEGRAPKNDPAIFTLAVAASYGNDNTRKAALDALADVCRTGTHLFTFVELVKGMRGWGRGLRRAVGAWYTGRSTRNLAYQLVKYRQRNGWTHADTLRLTHKKPQDSVQDAIFGWVTHPDQAAWAQTEAAPEHDAQAFIWAFEQAQRATQVETLLKLIADYDLPWEALPTQWLNDAAVWDALLQKLPMTAMIRSLGRLTRIGLIQPNSPAEAIVVERLTNPDLLRQARIHPIAVLSALRVYGLGYALKGRVNYLHASPGKEWMPTARVLDALDQAFEMAFHHVEPTKKRLMLALDVSGSMGGGMIAGVPGLTPRDGAAAMAMVTARTEPNYSVISFQKEIVPLNISARMRLDDVVNATHNLPFGATDCAQPMLYALKHKIAVDAFVIYTDSETWAGDVHPTQALRDYRQQMGIPARLIVVGMVSNGFTIADPADGGMMDIVGFDAAAPAVMAAFIKGEL